MCGESTKRRSVTDDPADVTCPDCLDAARLTDHAGTTEAGGVYISVEAPWP